MRSKRSWRANPGRRDGTKHGKGSRFATLWDYRARRWMVATTSVVASPRLSKASLAAGPRVRSLRVLGVDGSGAVSGTWAGGGEAASTAARSAASIARLSAALALPAAIRSRRPRPNSRVTRGHFDKRQPKTAVAISVAVVRTFTTDFCDTENGEIRSTGRLLRNS